LIALAHLSRRGWIDAAFERILVDSSTSLNIEGLCRDLGVTKGSFYHHFADRAELVGEIALIRDELLSGITQQAEAKADPAERFRAYCVGAFTSREYLHAEAFLERERVQLSEVDKAMQQADDEAYDWQLQAISDLGYSAADAPRFLTVLKAAAMGLVFFMMHEGRMFTLDERVEFANTLADVAEAGVRDC